MCLTVPIHSNINKWVWSLKYKWKDELIGIEFLNLIGFGMYMHIYIYIYIYRERERERESVWFEKVLFFSLFFFFFFFASNSSHCLNMGER